MGLAVAKIVTSIKRLVAVFASLIGLAIITILLYSLFIAGSVNQQDFVSQTIEVAIAIGFGSTILVFIRRTKPIMARHIGEQPTTILQIFMATIAVLFMVFAVLNTLGASPESLLTGAGFASITIGLIISTFVGGILAGALVFATHKLRVGDTVLINNIPGTVIELTALVTRIRTDIGVTTIPNSAISSGTIIVTKLQKYDAATQRRLPYLAGDRVVTTYMLGEGTVKELTSLRTVILLDSGRELVFLNSSILSGTIGVAKITSHVENPVV
jgi:small-conductance mechanosensitive channel